MALLLILTMVWCGIMALTIAVCGVLAFKADLNKPRYPTLISKEEII